MAKAHVTTTDGGNVYLEGTPSEIAALFRELRIEIKPPATPTKSSANKGNNARIRTTMNDLIDGLIGEQFFKKPRGLGDVKERLATLGHHYPITSLSGPLQGYARKRKLRRFKESGKYVYSQ